MSFSQLQAVKKCTKNGAPGIFFGPSYFVTALVLTKKLDLEFPYSFNFTQLQILNVELLMNLL